VQPGEDVLIMFSGIGALPLIIAKISSTATVVGIEKNPIAHEYAVQNLALNRKIRNVTFLVGDVLDVMPTLDRRFDRVAMPLPQSGALFLDIALAALKRDGALHFYDFQPAESFDDSVAKVQEACERNNRQFRNMQTVVCGHSSPRMYRICVDAKIG
jgi:tRNA G37 N-methylase Trm5